MKPIAETPTPPYYAVIFTNVTTGDMQGYAEMAEQMIELAAAQPGFLGVESARQDIGITVSYWNDIDSIKRWKAVTEHRQAQKLGRDQWYRAYTTRIAKVEREYSFTNE